MAGQNALETPDFRQLFTHLSLFKLYLPQLDLIARRLRLRDWESMVCYWRKQPGMIATSARGGKNKGRWALVRSCLFQALLLSGIWWILVDGDKGSWLIGAPAVALAVAVGVLAGHRAPTHWQLSGWLRFLPFFVGKSLLGAFDVARRVYHHRIDLAPAFYDYPIRLTTEPAQVFFANAVSLLPGTLSAELRDDQLVVHALDSTQPVKRDLAILEERVAQLFGQTASLTETIE